MPPILYVLQHARYYGAVKLVPCSPRGDLPKMLKASKACGFVFFDAVAAAVLKCRAFEVASNPMTRSRPTYKKIVLRTEVPHQIKCRIKSGRVAIASGYNVDGKVPEKVRREAAARTKDASGRRSGENEGCSGRRSGENEGCKRTQNSEWRKKKTSRTRPADTSMHRSRVRKGMHRSRVALQKEKENLTKTCATLAPGCTFSGAHCPLLWHGQPPSAPVPRRLVNDLRAREVRTHHRHAWSEQSAPPPPGRVPGREQRRHARDATKDQCLHRRAASGEWCLGSIPSIPSIHSIGSSDESS
jgi:hypothetical protein